MDGVSQKGTLLQSQEIRAAPTVQIQEVAGPGQVVLQATKSHIKILSGPTGATISELVYAPPEGDQTDEE